MFCVYLTIVNDKECTNITLKDKGFTNMNSFSNFETYANCFQTRLPTSNNPADRFLLLVFSRPDMEQAYRGLCTQDLEVLRRNVRCLLTTPPLRSCYASFNQGVTQVANMLTENRFPRETLQTLACNVSVARYQCETNVYAHCDQRTGEIMQDFFFATVPGACRRAAGVRSRYVPFSTGGSAKLDVAKHWVTIPALLFVLTFGCVM